MQTTRLKTTTKRRRNKSSLFFLFTYNKQTMAKTKLVLFDVDNTLVNVGEAHAQVFVQGFKKFFDINITPKEVMLQGYTDLQIIHTILDKHKKDVDMQKVSQMINYSIEEFQKADLHESTLFQGVPELLESLKKGGAVIGLVTGNITEIAYTKLRHFHIDHYFLLGGFGESSTIRSELVESAIQQAEQKSGPINKNDVFIIGDTIRDISAAKDAGVKVIAVAHRENTYEELKEKNPDHLYKDLTDTQTITNVILND